MVDRHAQRVKQMFGSIAHRYDLINRLASFSIDRRWRAFTRRKVAALLPVEARVLDLCTGTGDLALELAKKIPASRVIGCDFCHPMLVQGIAKARRHNSDRGTHFVEGDALSLPFPSACFDGLTIAFGFRNLENYESGLTEMNRVLKTGGVLALLDFAEPTLPVFRNIYHLYFHHLLPRLGGLISGQKDPYSYLPQSVREFPAAARLEEMLLKSGFQDNRHHGLTGGIAFLHLARKL